MCMCMCICIYTCAALSDLTRCKRLRSGRPTDGCVGTSAHRWSELEPGAVAAGTGVGLNEDSPPCQIRIAWGPGLVGSIIVWYWTGVSYVHAGSYVHAAMCMQAAMCRQLCACRHRSSR